MNDIEIRRTPDGRWKGTLHLPLGGYYDSYAALTPYGGRLDLGRKLHPKAVEDIVCLSNPFPVVWLEAFTKTPPELWPDVNRLLTAVWARAQESTPVS
jgi:hypothetical protein